jgi:hypothetical protein
MLRVRGQEGYPPGAAFAGEVADVGGGEEALSDPGGPEDAAVGERRLRLVVDANGRCLARSRGRVPRGLSAGDGHRRGVGC